MKSRKCKKCDRYFIPLQWNQIYCGSKTQHIGCSWENVSSDRSRRRWKDKKYKEYQREYQKKWRKEQRRKNTQYAKRQRQSKKEYLYNRGGIKKAKEWRRKNIDKVLEWNRKRVLKKKGVIGSHTKKEWKELKKKYNYCCAECRINEKELIKKWEGTFFIKLTKDHIIPLSKGGTDYIDNIQPLCVSCNARKKDKLWQKKIEK